MKPVSISRKDGLVEPVPLGINRVHTAGGSGCPSSAKQENPRNLTQVPVKLNILSILSLNYTFFDRKNLEKFLFPEVCDTQSSLPNTVKSARTGCCCSEFPGGRDTHRCSSSPSFPLRPHSHSTNLFHSMIRAAPQLPHPAHHRASLSPLCHVAQRPKERNWELGM